MPSHVWNDITYPFTNLAVHRTPLGLDQSFHHTLYNGCNYLSILGLKLIHVSKEGPSYPIPQTYHRPSIAYCHSHPKYNTWRFINGMPIKAASQF